MSIAPSRRRKAPPGADLSRDAIIDAATRLIRALGAEAFSMRVLGAELKVSATALYYHVGSKDALLEEVFCRVLGTVTAAGDDLPWPLALEELLVRLQYLAADYQGLQAFMAEHQQSRATLLWMEMILRILMRGGFPDVMAGQALVMMAFYNSPVSLRAHRPVNAGPWDRDIDPQSIAGASHRLAESFPAVVQVAPYIHPPDEALFRTGLKSLIRGLEHRLERAKA